MLRKEGEKEGERERGTYEKGEDDEGEGQRKDD